MLFTKKNKENTSTTKKNKENTSTIKKNSKKPRSWPFNQEKKQVLRSFFLSFLIFHLNDEFIC